MKYHSNLFAKIVFVLLIFGFAFFLVIPAHAQASEETEVPVLQKVGSRYFRCYRMENAVYDEEKFKKLIANENCSKPGTLLKVDFEKHTLIGFKTGGDCFVRAAAKVFRSEKTKTYKNNKHLGRMPRRRQV
jgi:hypothetical protein